MGDRGPSSNTLHVRGEEHSPVVFRLNRIQGLASGVKFDPVSNIGADDAKVEVRRLREDVNKHDLRKDLHEVCRTEVGPRRHRFRTPAGVPIHNRLEELGLVKFLDFNSHNLHLGADARCGAAVLGIDLVEGIQNTELYLKINGRSVRPSQRTARLGGRCREGTDDPTLRTLLSGLTSVTEISRIAAVPQLPALGSGRFVWLTRCYPFVKKFASRTQLLLLRR